MKRELRGPPVVVVVGSGDGVRDIVLTPIVELTLEETRIGQQVFYRGTKRPIAVLVRTPDGERRIELEAGPSGQP